MQGLQRNVRASLKFLLVDKESANVGSLGVLLHQVGFFDVEKCLSFKEAVMDQQRFLADIVFIEGDMPGSTQEEMLKTFKGVKESSKIIIMSSESTAENVRRALELGASGFLAKPFRANDVINTLKRVSRQKKK